LPRWTVGPGPGSATQINRGTGSADVARRAREMPTPPAGLGYHGLTIRANRFGAPRLAPCLLRSVDDGA